MFRPHIASHRQVYMQLFTFEEMSHFWMEDKVKCDTQDEIRRDKNWNGILGI